MTRFLFAVIVVPVRHGTTASPGEILAIIGIATLAVVLIFMGFFAYNKVAQDLDRPKK